MKHSLLLVDVIIHEPDRSHEMGGRAREAARRFSALGVRRTGPGTPTGALSQSLNP